MKRKKTLQVGAEALRKTIAASKQLNTEGELLATVEYHQVCLLREKKNQLNLSHTALQKKNKTEIDLLNVSEVGRSM